MRLNGGGTSSWPACPGRRERSSMSGNQWQSVAVGEALAYSLEGPPSQSVPLSFGTRLLP